MLLCEISRYGYWCCYVRYLDMGTGVVTSFIGIEDTKFATAEGMDP